MGSIHQQNIFNSIKNEEENQRYDFLHSHVEPGLVHDCMASIPIGFSALLPRI